MSGIFVPSWRRQRYSQLRLVHDEIGFKYVRFHGTFADDTGAYHEVDGKPVYDFSKTAVVYDAILKVLVGSDGIFRYTLPMRTNDVVLVKLTRVR